MQDGPNNPPDGIHLVWCEAECLEGLLTCLIVCLVCNRVHPGGAALTDEVVGIHVAFQLQP